MSVPVRERMKDMYDMLLIANLKINKEKKSRLVGWSFDGVNKGRGHVNTLLPSRQSHRHSVHDTCRSRF